MPGDTLKVEGKQEIYPASSGTPETVVQRVAMDVAAYWYYPKESAAQGRLPIILLQSIQVMDIKPGLGMNN